MPEEITGYYVDLDTDSDNIDSVNEIEVGMSASDYSGTDTALLNGETDTHYPTIEWYANTAIESVVVNGSGVEVKVLIGGHHPIPRPK